MKNIENEVRAFRGGSWNRDSGYCRASNRGWYVPGFRCIFFGFRVVHRKGKT